MATPLPLAKPGDDGCWRIIGMRGDRSCPELETVTHCRNCPVFAAAGRRLFEQAPPPEYLAHWASLLAETKTDDAPSAHSVLLFRLGVEWLALDTGLMVEIAETRPVHRIAHRTGGILSGVVNIRGRLALCVSLRALLGIADAPAAAIPTGARRAHKRLVVIERGRDGWVFDVDEVHGVHRFASVELGIAPSTVSESLATLSRGLFVWEDRRVGYLDGDKLFAAIQRRSA
jgi:chemotaxis-related protein WspD